MSSGGGVASELLLPEVVPLGGAPRFGAPRLMTSSGIPDVDPDDAVADALLLDPLFRLMIISGTPFAPFVFEAVPVVDGWPAGEGAPTATPDDVLKLMTISATTLPLFWPLLRFTTVAGLSCAGVAVLFWRLLFKFAKAACAPAKSPACNAVPMASKA